MRRTCKLPDMLARIKYIDFRRDQDFEEGVMTLVSIIRGLPLPRGADITEADVHFRDDAALLKQHRRIFERPAFKVSCIWELFLPELLEAIDDTASALNTGSLYSRSDNLLSSFDDSNEYKLPEFRRAFKYIGEKLTTLKRRVTEFEEFFRSICPGYSHHDNFYAMVMSAARDNPHDVPAIFEFMDAIDRMRNDILDELNPLLTKCGEEAFNPIELSSAVVRKNRIGGGDWSTKFDSVLPFIV